jgi:carboxyl-terminal processing protease
MYRPLISKLLLVIIFASLGFAGGYHYAKVDIPEVDKVTELSGKSNEIATTVDFTPFWKVWNVLNAKYVPADVGTSSTAAKNIYTQKLVWGAISGLTAAVGDPYTIFLPPSESEIFKGDISGNFSGVGMEIGIRNEQLLVIAPLKDSPAERAGIKPKDKILKIDDELAQGLRIDEAVSKIRGPEGTEVKLLLQREEGEPFEVKITRALIDLPTIKTELRQTEGNKIFVLSLYGFSGNSPNLFRDALREFIDSGTDKLIIDLRGNPGGYLEAAVDMASFFLPEGKIVVREYYGEGREENLHRSKGYDIFNENLKLVILVNEGSASASEILAGALQEYGRAKLVGQTTFGKGSVQELVDITGETSLKVTVARWLTPLGKSISERGLDPDYKVEFTEADIENEKDVQMNKAIELLIEGI